MNNAKLILFFWLAVKVTSQTAADDASLVYAYVAESASQTFREASGELPFPYLVPAGPYDEVWDWDSMFMGVALSQFGAIPYFQGTFLNFLYFTNTSTG